MMIPNGISSEAITKETKFCVQTEFAHRPKPRITTTISLNGEVVEKVETDWKISPLTEKDKQEIEQFLKKQHQKVIEKIKQKNDQPERDPWRENHRDLNLEDAVVRIDRELSETDGVSGWIFLLKDGQVLSHRISDPEDKERFEQIRVFSELFSSTTRVGEFTGGILELPTGLSVLVPIKNHFLGIRLNPHIDPKDLVAKIKTLI